MGLSSVNALRLLTPVGRSALVIVLTYLVGIIGLSWPVSRALFLALTPVHLLLTLVLLLAAQRPGRTWMLWSAVAMLGYGVEVVGVRTGLIFGTYAYGPVLGPHLLDTPPLIGANWLLLVASASAIVPSWGPRGLARSLAVALVLVGLDALMEPVAVAMSMWHWAQADIPLQNYLGWFGLAFILAELYRRALPEVQNPLAGLLLGCQLLFFAVLRLTLVSG